MVLQFMYVSGGNISIRILWHRLDSTSMYWRNVQVKEKIYTEFCLDDSPAEILEMYSAML